MLHWKWKGGSPDARGPSAINQMPPFNNSMLKSKQFFNWAANAIIIWSNSIFAMKYVVRERDTDFVHSGICIYLVFFFFYGHRKDLQYTSNLPCFYFAPSFQLRTILSQEFFVSALCIFSVVVHCIRAIS